MMRATGLKRGSRKKQPHQTSPPQEVMDKEDPAQRPVMVVKQPQQQQPMVQHTQQQTQEIVQQRRRPNDEVAGLTTKNYRLAKELADLRVRHRDESKNVTRLTMENMNLASRCREAISHVAMLKKELAMQQKRTAAALASQREQTQRMADSLSNSMEMSRLSRANSEASGDAKPDNDLSRLATATPSPLRNNPSESFSPASSKSTISSRPPSPPEEARDSPPIDSTSPLARRGSSLDEDDTIVDTIAQVSTVSNSPTESAKEDTELSQPAKDKKGSGVYTTPKRSEKWVPNLRGPTARVGIDEGGLFPHSASPQVLPARKKSYNEEYPGDIPNGKDDGSGAFPSANSQSRKINLLNSIDAFEQSFSVDFPDSFTTKEGNAGPGVISRKQTDIYNPFFATPERAGRRSKQVSDSFQDGEEKKTNEPSDYFETPPRLPRVKVAPEGEPPRPEKIGSSAARERYEKALKPRQGAPPTDNANQSGGLDSKPVDISLIESTKSSLRSTVVDIVDAFEGSIDFNEEKSDSSSRRMSIRRSVKQPISYAEPALNTKLRRGDTYFPKSEGDEQPRIVTPRAVSP